MPDADHKRHLHELETFFANPAICRDSFRLLIHFAIRLAAVGHTTDVLAIVEHSPEAKLFQPLAAGLRLHLGISTGPMDDSRTLALQIASKIADEIKAHHAVITLHV